MNIRHFDINGNLIRVEFVDLVVEPTAEDRIAALEREVRGMKDRAAAEAAKTSPTPRSVAEALAAD